MRIAGLEFDVGLSQGIRHLVWAQDYRVHGLIAVRAGRALCTPQDPAPDPAPGERPDCRWCLLEASKLDPDFTLDVPVPVHPQQMSLFG